MNEAVQARVAWLEKLLYEAWGPAPDGAAWSVHHDWGTVHLKGPERIDINTGNIHTALDYATLLLTALIETRSSGMLTPYVPDMRMISDEIEWFDFSSGAVGYHRPSKTKIQVWAGARTYEVTLNGNAVLTRPNAHRKRWRSKEAAKTGAEEALLRQLEAAGNVLKEGA